VKIIAVDNVVYVLKKRRNEERGVAFVRRRSHWRKRLPTFTRKKEERSLAEKKLGRSLGKKTIKRRSLNLQRCSCNLSVENGLFHGGGQKGGAATARGGENRNANVTEKGVCEVSYAGRKKTSKKGKKQRIHGKRVRFEHLARFREKAPLQILAKR